MFINVPGVSRYTFKLNMLTGEVRLDQSIENLHEAIEMLKELSGFGGDEDYDKDKLELDRKKAKVLEYIKKENIELIKLWEKYGKN